jgi:hypothetical protein
MLSNGASALARYAVTGGIDDASWAHCLETGMAKTIAERQAAYRARRATSGKNGDGQRRINMWISTGAALALGRLARRYGVTQQAFVEQVLLAEDERVLGTIPAESEQWDQYFGIETSSHIDESKLGNSD